jgi:antitoxin MazE
MPERDMKMQLGIWGRSLAVRLPKALVEKFGLKEGDEIDVAALERALAESREDRRREALEAIARTQWELPEDFKFDRDEMYDEELGIKAR